MRYRGIIAIRLAAGLILAAATHSAAGSTPRTQTSSAGAIFTQIAPPNPALGEAWADPTGVIWGDTVKNADGSVRWLDLGDATSYCQSIGARIATTADFLRLRAYFGGQSASYQGYVPQILPDLANTWFWAPSTSGASGVFIGGVGVMFANGTYYDVATRCLVDP